MSQETCHRCKCRQCRRGVRKSALAPLPLERRFVVVATVTSFVFWLILGSLSGLFLKRFELAK